ncbi:unnamed protein product [Strongylus vulgaris]|uniref:Protein-lysine N-methyltransferase n=1 Tax=Strongylus vulgaris TaxID=40348 RepID=A0A3P7IDB2_STRVU|nr:unnamed protein product [Strongylus vulgaris]
MLIFQLSQFWYASETALQLCHELIEAVGGNGRIACISCPTLMQYFPNIDSYNKDSVVIKLLEYDHRFEKKFPEEYVPYDYRHPLAVPSELKGNRHFCIKLSPAIMFQLAGVFDVVIADPPFLADECLVKTAQTIRMLAKPNAKIILCTGAVMEKMAHRLLGLHRLKFEPQHANNLSNEFSCFANYETKYL